MSDQGVTRRVEKGGQTRLEMKEVVSTESQWEMTQEVMGRLPRSSSSSHYLSG